MNATSGITIAPLLPRIHYLDILLPPLLILLSLLLHTIYNEPSPTEPVHSHVFHAKTAHARFLPVEAKHVFSYPVLFFGLDLDALESDAMDLGRLFGYQGTRKGRWRVTALSPSAYLDADVPGEELQSIKEKLLGYLEKKGVGRELAKRVYTVTMPAYLGFEGINPLTVHYCYSEEEDSTRKLEVVVLEVHNTFGERHIYLLRSNKEEDTDVAVGYEHQWTFPRSFHVSPFNDRTGFYRVSLTDPLAVHTLFPNPTHPTLSLKIIFLTSSHEKKLYASLAGPSVPLTEGAIISALLRWPVSLLLTTPRILYQAMKLHYSKRLDVFPRPEPFVVESVEEGEVNPVEGGGKEGAVGYFDGEEDMYKEVVVRYMQRRVDEMMKTEGKRIEVSFVPAGRTENRTTITPSSSSSQESSEEKLRIDYLTPMTFSDLITSPTVELALQLGSKIEQRWSTSNDSLFLRLLAPPATTALDSHGPTWRSELLDRIRHRQFEWGRSFSPSRTPSLPPSAIPSNPLTSSAPSLALIKSIWLQFFVVRLGYWIFVLSGARFVKGMETWMEWARWEEAQIQRKGRGKGEAKYGSVLDSS